MNSSTSSSPSTEYNLSNETNRVSIYVLPFLMSLIVITNTLNIIVLSRRALRPSSCTHYFLALAISSLVYLPFTPMNIFLMNRFGMSMSRSPFGCKIQSFFIYSSALFFTTTLVCASFDRYCTSSSSAYLRSFSRPRVAQRTILIVTLVIIIYMCPFFIISYWNFTTNRCEQYTSAITVVYLSSRVVVYYIVGPSAMALFGVLTIRNIRSQASRVAPVSQPVSRQHRSRRTERQLSRMLIIQVSVHLLFSLPTAVTYILITFVPSIITPLVTGIRSISIIWQQGTFFLSFFLYILSGDVYRRELEKIFKLNRNQDRTITREILLQPWVSATVPANTRALVHQN